MHFSICLVFIGVLERMKKMCVYPWYQGIELLLRVFYWNDCNHYVDRPFKNRIT